MTFCTELHDLLRGPGRFLPEPMGNVPVGLHNPALRMAVQASAQGRFIRNIFFGNSVVQRIFMAKFAIRFGVPHQFAILRMDAMGAAIENPHDLFMGKLVLRKGRFDMALGSAIDFLGDWVVGDFGNVGVTVFTIDGLVNAPAVV